LNKEKDLGGSMPHRSVKRRDNDFMYSISQLHESRDQSKPGSRRTVDLLRKRCVATPPSHYEPLPVLFLNGFILARFLPEVK
jgi:hypothetical protein